MHTCSIIGQKRQSVPIHSSQTMGRIPGVKSRKCSHTIFPENSSNISGLLFVHKCDPVENPIGIYQKKNVQGSHRLLTTLPTCKKTKLSWVISTFPNFLNSLIYQTSREASNRVLFPKDFHFVHYKSLIDGKKLISLTI